MRIHLDYTLIRDHFNIEDEVSIRMTQDEFALLWAVMKSLDSDNCSEQYAVKDRYISKSKSMLGVLDEAWESLKKCSDKKDK